MSATTMKPILFSGPMVRAIMEGRKTVTRRVVKPQPQCDERYGGIGYWHWFGGKALLRAGYGADYVHTSADALKDAIVKCAKYQPGDLLYVREKHSFLERGSPIVQCRQVWYWVDGQPEHGDWTRPKPSIHMPREAARLFLRVTDARVERLQDITEADAILEGVNGGCLACGQHQPCDCAEPMPDHCDSFIWLWDSLNAKRGYPWDSNPWVWRYEFEQVAA